jgi:SAM-dependent methyltransferase
MVDHCANKTFLALGLQWWDGGQQEKAVIGEVDDSGENGKKRKSAEQIAQPAALEFKVTHDKDYGLKTFLSAVRKGAKQRWLINRSLMDAFVFAFQKAGIEIKPDQNLTVLDLGCGYCQEALVINGFFGDKLMGDTSPTVKVIGIDISEKTIKEAIKANTVKGSSTSPSKVPDYLLLKQADATKLDQYDFIPEKVDVITIRHQHISGNEETWTKIFQQALNKVKDGGVVVLTSYIGFEHSMMLEAMRSIGAEIVFSGENLGKVILEKDSRMRSELIPATNSHVAIVRKKPNPELNV